MSEVINSPTKTKARKQHRCNFCSYKIEKGSTYLRTTLKNDGELYTWKAHDLCNEISNKLKMYDDCDEGLTTDMFQYEIINEYQNITNYKGHSFKEPFIFYLNVVLNHHLSTQLINSPPISQGLHLP